MAKLSAPRSGHVLSDGQQAVVVSAETNEVVSFNVLDGSRGETRKWEAWAKSGRHQNRYVLSYLPGEGMRRYTLRLVDAFAGEVVQELTTESSGRGAEGLAAAYGRVIDGRYLALLHTDGNTHLWDIQQGRELGVAKLPVMQDLQRHCTRCCWKIKSSCCHGEGKQKRCH